MIYYIIVVFLLILFIASIIFSAIMLKKKHKKYIKDFKKVNDMKKCPETAKYFINFQSTYQTWPLALIASGLFSIIILLLMIFINALSTNKIPNEYVAILSIFIYIGAFLAVYKIENCVIGRMCGWQTCASPYL